MTVCPFASWKPVQNHSGPMSAHLGLVLHVQQGNGGLQGWFDNPSSGASSTWWVGKNGDLEQYVDADLKAWAQGDGNATYNSVETEGFDTEPLTTAQEATLARLYQWGSQRYGWLDLLAEHPGDNGFGWHGMGGSSWGGHVDCPGNLRKPRRQPILDQAFGHGPQPQETYDMGPATCVDTDDTPWYFMTGKDGQIWANAGGKPNNWWSLGGGDHLDPHSGPDAAVQPDGTLVVAATGKDGAVWVSSRNPRDGKWTSWWSAGGK